MNAVASKRRPMASSVTTSRLDSLLAAAAAHDLDRVNQQRRDLLRYIGKLEEERDARNAKGVLPREAQD